MRGGYQGFMNRYINPYHRPALFPLTIVSPSQPFVIAVELLEFHERNGPDSNIRSMRYVYAYI